ncbi:ZIP zinc transporter-domain-containing protein [Dendryphion nanum]|uniref:ZIP zinc transporter-domain-containing protein n=1 Tax=Dendryphion nanum TaxID=256645 RepID=A0A9P9INJ1_9PLEO|nr:ZIP zinc transporter-domain-containing protein [Dendryphion nanum]
MNCPSRTDEDLLLNPGWNQNPPRFAADLTTCEDLNGIANARELGEAERWKVSNEALGQCNLAQNISYGPSDLPVATTWGAKGPHRGPCTHFKERDVPAGSEHGVQVSRGGSGSGWTRWALSVFCTSMMVSFIFNSGLPAMARVFSMLWAPKEPRASSNASMTRAKRNTCATGGVGSGYNLPFHVGALFIILFVSSTACAFPLLVIKFPRLRIPASFLFSARHFGTGVLIATAFVHLLPTAFISLGNPCLSGFWTTDYPAMPGAIALAAIFFVTLVEMVFSPGRHCTGGHADMKAVSRNAQGHSHAHTSETVERPVLERNRPSATTETVETRNIGPIRGRRTSISRTLSRMGEENQILDAAELRRGEALQGNKKMDECAIEDTERNLSAAEMTPDQLHKKAVMQCFLLEMGILFHSIFIGMSLSVSVGSEFVILLIAIIFHQTFEGLALGARIGAIEWPQGALQPWIMALAYGCTTPLGQAIGIATHTLYSPDSEVGLLIVGIMNAISSGLLVFASLVELMSEDFLSDESWVVLRGRRRVYACILVFSGAFSMSLVGAWA